MAVVIIHVCWNHLREVYELREVTVSEPQNASVRD